MNPGSDMSCSWASSVTARSPSASSCSTWRRVRSDRAANSVSSASSEYLTIRFSIQASPWFVNIRLQDHPARAAFLIAKRLIPGRLSCFAAGGGCRAARGARLARGGFRSSGAGPARPCAAFFPGAASSDGSARGSLYPGAARGATLARPARARAALVQACAPPPSRRPWRRLAKKWPSCFPARPLRPMPRRSALTRPSRRKQTPPRRFPGRCSEQGDEYALDLEKGPGTKQQLPGSVHKPTYAHCAACSVR
jgi:hypothetical protein